MPNRLKTIWSVFIYLLALGGVSKIFAEATHVEIKGDHLYIDGRPFFIQAVGYAPWRPKQWPDPPTAQVDPALIEADFQRIKQAGFNTVRSWGSLNPKELALADKYGLKVIQGIWLNPNIDYGNPLVQESLLKELRWEVEMGQEAPNIIMWMPITEPKPNAILGSGIKETEIFFKKLKDTIRELDSRPVSMDSWLSVGFVDHSMWDVVTFNTFAFAPASISYALGFEGYNEWIRTNVAHGKPYFVGETGGYSVSPSTFGVKGGGAGGFTEADQSRLNLSCLRDIENSGAIGWTLVSWVDTWHYPEDPDTHDPNEPWEWDGILGFKNESDTLGTPRRIFYDLPKYNEQTAGRVKRRKTSKTETDAINIVIRQEPSKDVLSHNFRFTASLKWRGGKMAPHVPVRIGYFIPEPWQEARSDGNTDDNGEITFESPLLISKNDQVLIVALGALDRKQNHIGKNITFVHQ